MKKLKDISVRELLSIEDGFYQLETPVAYAMGGEEKEYVSTETELKYNESSPVATFDASIPDLTAPTIGELYNVKITFSTGITAEREVECGSVPAPMIPIPADMFDGVSGVA